MAASASNHKVKTCFECPFVEWTSVVKNWNGTISKKSKHLIHCKYDQEYERIWYNEIPPWCDLRDGPIHVELDGDYRDRKK
jgi:hypothetical protein